jgi:hypothetical protein
MAFTLRVSFITLLMFPSIISRGLSLTVTIVTVQLIYFKFKKNTTKSNIIISLFSISLFNLPQGTDVIKFMVMSEGARNHGAGAGMHEAIRTYSSV